MTHSIPPRSPQEISAAAARLAGRCAECSHGLAAHAPDGSCRICQMQGRTADSGLCPGFRSVDPWADEPVGHRRLRVALEGVGGGNAYLVGIENSGALQCSTPGCRETADEHFPDPAADSGLGACREPGCPCTDWTYVVPGSEEDVLRRAAAVAGSMAEAIGAASCDEETAHRTVAALRQHRADLEVILAAPDDDVVDAEVGSSGDPLLDLIHDVLARSWPTVDGRWVAVRDELTDAVRAAAQVRWS